MPKASFLSRQVGQSGPRNTNYKGGTCLNEKGYLRISSGPHRNRYVHRQVLADLCAVWCYYPLNARTGLPDGMSVEHLDHRRTHNCISNLILLDLRIHNALSWRSWLNMPVLGEVGFGLAYDTYNDPALVNDPDAYHGEF